MPSQQAGFLFDLDGTLIDGVYQHVLAWHEALDLILPLALRRLARRGHPVTALHNDKGPVGQPSLGNGLRAVLPRDGSLDELAAAAFWLCAPGTCFRWVEWDGVLTTKLAAQTGPIHVPIFS